MNRFPLKQAISDGAFEAKVKLSELLDKVEHGEQVVVTRPGKPIARLAPEGGNHVAELTSTAVLLEAARRQIEHDRHDMRGARMPPLIDAPSHAVFYPRIVGPSADA